MTLQGLHSHTSCACPSGRYAVRENVIRLPQLGQDFGMIFSMICLDRKEVMEQAKCGLSHPHVVWLVPVPTPLLGSL